MEPAVVAAVLADAEFPPVVLADAGKGRSSMSVRLGSAVFPAVVFIEFPVAVVEALSKGEMVVGVVRVVDPAGPRVVGDPKDPLRLLLACGFSEEGFDITAPGSVVFPLGE